MSNSSASHRAPPLPLYCLQVTKVPLCPPLHISAEEARGVLVAPGSKPRPEGERMAASYINFYIANGGVVMPAFGGEAAEADERWAVGCGWQGVSLQGAVGRPRRPGGALCSQELASFHPPSHPPPTSGSLCCVFPQAAGHGGCWRACSPTTAWWRCRGARLCWAAATYTASRSSSPGACR